MTDSDILIVKDNFCLNVCYIQFMVVKIEKFYGEDSLFNKWYWKNRTATC